VRDMTTTVDPQSTTTAHIDLGELARVSAELERQPATAAISWAWERYGTRMIVAASFQDCVLIDLAMQVAPEMEIVFLDTQYHFPETLEYVETVRRRYDLNLRVMEPLAEPDDLWKIDTTECCAVRKVEPLARALAGCDAWMTGLRRDEASTRAKAPIVGLDAGRGIVKVNPLAPWTHTDGEGEDPRAGRWAGTGKLECGLHGWPTP
jgi:phosphoadenosine phosphosulfate reductase